MVPGQPISKQELIGQILAGLRDDKHSCHPYRVQFASSFVHCIFNKGAGEGMSEQFIEKDRDQQFSCVEDFIIALTFELDKESASSVSISKGELSESKDSIDPCFIVPGLFEYSEVACLSNEDLQGGMLEHQDEGISDCRPSQCQDLLESCGQDDESLPCRMIDGRVVWETTCLDVSANRLDAEEDESDSDDDGGEMTRKVGGYGRRKMKVVTEVKGDSASFLGRREKAGGSPGRGTTKMGRDLPVGVRFTETEGSRQVVDDADKEVAQSKQSIKLESGGQLEMSVTQSEMMSGQQHITDTTLELDVVQAGNKGEEEEESRSDLTGVEIEVGIDKDSVVSFHTKLRESSREGSVDCVAVVGTVGPDEACSESTTVVGSSDCTYTPGSGCVLELDGTDIDSFSAIAGAGHSTYTVGGRAGGQGTTCTVSCEDKGSKPVSAGPATYTVGSEYLVSGLHGADTGDEVVKEDLSLTTHATHTIDKIQTYSVGGEKTGTGCSSISTDLEDVLNECEPGCFVEVTEEGSNLVRDHGDLANKVEARGCGVFVDSMLEQSCTEPVLVFSESNEDELKGQDEDSVLQELNARLCKDTGAMLVAPAGFINLGFDDSTIDSDSSDNVWNEDTRRLKCVRKFVKKWRRKVFIRKWPMAESCCENRDIPAAVMDLSLNGNHSRSEMQLGSSVDTGHRGELESVVDSQCCSGVVGDRSEVLSLKDSLSLPSLSAGRCLELSKDACRLVNRDNNEEDLDKVEKRCTLILAGRQVVLAGGEGIQDAWSDQAVASLTEKDTNSVNDAESGTNLSSEEKMATKQMYESFIPSCPDETYAACSNDKVPADPMEEDHKKFVCTIRSDQPLDQRVSISYSPTEPSGEMYELDSAPELQIRVRFAGSVLAKIGPGQQEACSLATNSEEEEEAGLSLSRSIVSAAVPILIPDGGGLGPAASAMDTTVSDQLELLVGLLDVFFWFCLAAFIVLYEFVWYFLALVLY